MEINPLGWGIQQMSSGLKSVTLNPIKDIISYAVPWIKASMDRHTYVEKENRPLAKLMGGDLVVDSLQNEIAHLARVAGIKGEICIYTSVSAPFSGYRGILGKVITLPLEHAHEKRFEQVKTDEYLLADDELEQNKWEFSENEMRFLMSASIAELRTFPLLKVISRIVILALMIGLFFTPLSMYAVGSAFVAGSVLYFAIDRLIGNRVDKYAQEILKQRFKEAGMLDRSARIQSLAVATNTLKKIQLQQLDIRRRNDFCKLLINSDGDLRFDFTVPSNKTRIQKLQKRQSELFKLNRQDSLLLPRYPRLRTAAHPQQ
jgi:Zn-dependent membrane protease YugP